MEILSREIDAARRAGQPLAFPIRVREPGEMRVRYFFGDSFEIVRARDPDDPRLRYLLIGEGRTPSAPVALRRMERGEERPVQLR